MAQNTNTHTNVRAMNEKKRTNQNKTNIKLHLLQCENRFTWQFILDYFQVGGFMIFSASILTYTTR